MDVGMWVGCVWHGDVRRIGAWHGWGVGKLASEWFGVWRIGTWGRVGTSGWVSGRVHTFACWRKWVRSQVDAMARVCVGVLARLGVACQHGLNTAQEALHKDLLVNVKDIRTESIARVKDLNDRHAEREGRNVQHVEQRRF